ncbi:MAG: PadR family transcriptional regulator [Limnochordaceae bacterium]|nr:PadR family transcriptional regulator [Limnochordaceae bacterium]
MARILLSLARGPLHGYRLLELQEQETWGDAPRLLPGTLYRWLRELERAGLAVSSWEAGESGPARRTYVLTPQGWELLEELIRHLRRQRQAIDDVLEAYGRLRAPGPASGEERR